MTAQDRFIAYALDFERTYQDDDWSRLEPYFAEDVVYAAARLLDPGLATSPREPQTVLDHPVAQHLDRKPQAVQLRQLLVGQRRAEPLVPGPDEGNRFAPQPRGQTPIARTAAALRRQAPAPSATYASRNRRIWRCVTPTLRAASHCVSRFSITRSITRTRSSSS